MKNGWFSTVGVGALARLIDTGGLVGAIVDELDAKVLFEEIRQLAPELGFRRVHLAVGVDQLVDGVHELFLVVRVEALEDLEAAQLELGVHEVVLLLAGRHRFVEQLLHLSVDALEHFVEVRGELLLQLDAERLIVGRRWHR